MPEVLESSMMSEDKKEYFRRKNLIQMALIEAFKPNEDTTAQADWIGPLGSKVSEFIEENQSMSNKEILQELINIYKDKKNEKRLSEINLDELIENCNYEMDV